MQKNGGVSSNITIDVSNIYPGMETFERVIDVKNRGEVRATLSYEIESLKILSDTYDSNTYTTAQLYNRMQTMYPFKIDIVSNDSNLVAGTGSGEFRITVSWPFESNQDDVDTNWGTRAYEYYNAHPTERMY